MGSPLLLPAHPLKRGDLAEVTFQSVTVTIFIPLTDRLTKCIAVFVSFSIMYRLFVHGMSLVTNLSQNMSTNLFFLGFLLLHSLNFDDCLILRIVYFYTGNG